MLLGTAVSNGEGFPYSDVRADVILGAAKNFIPLASCNSLQLRPDASLREA
jgi:hypothetical protein